MFRRIYFFMLFLLYILLTCNSTTKQASILYGNWVQVHDEDFSMTILFKEKSFLLKYISSEINSRRCTVDLHGSWVISNDTIYFEKNRALEFCSNRKDTLDKTHSYDMVPWKILSILENRLVVETDDFNAPLKKFNKIRKDN